VVVGRRPKEPNKAARAYFQSLGSGSDFDLVMSRQRDSRRYAMVQEVLDLRSERPSSQSHFAGFLRLQLPRRAR
jgi:hypothetical protein